MNCIYLIDRRETIVYEEFLRLNFPEITVMRSFALPKTSTIKDFEENKVAVLEFCKTENITLAVSFGSASRLVSPEFALAPFGLYKHLSGLYILQLPELRHLVPWESKDLPYSSNEIRDFLNYYLSHLRNGEPCFDLKVSEDIKAVSYENFFLDTDFKVVFKAEEFDLETVIEDRENNDLGFDTETTGLNYWENGWSVLCCSFAWKAKSSNKYYVRIIDCSNEELRQKLEDFIEKTVIQNKLCLVGNNVKYDLKAWKVYSKWDDQRLRNWLDALEFSDISFLSIAENNSSTKIALKQLVPRYLKFPPYQYLVSTNFYSGTPEIFIRAKYDPSILDSADLKAYMYLDTVAPLLLKSKFPNADLNLLKFVLCPLAKELVFVETRGLKVDFQLVDRWSKLVGDELDKYKQSFKSKYEIDKPGSRQQCLNAFKALGAELVKTTKAGSEALDKATLDKLSLSKNEKVAQLAKDLLIVRDMQTLLSNFLDRDKYKGLCASDDRIKCDYKLCFVGSGRLSCGSEGSGKNRTSVNLQQQPGVRFQKKKGLEVYAEARKTRRIFIPEEGSLFLDSDVSQAEVRVASYIWQASSWLDCYNPANPKDFYIELAKKLRKKEHPDNDDRQAMKPIVLGVMYMMGPKTFGQLLGTDPVTAKKLFNQMLKEYPELRCYFNKMQEYLKIPDKVIQAPTRKRSSKNLTWKIPAEKRSDFEKKDFFAIWRTFCNFPIQGCTSDIVIRIVVRLTKKLIEKFPEFKIELLNLVHDSFLYEVSRKDNTKITIEDMLPIKQFIEDSVKNYGFEEDPEFFSWMTTNLSKDFKSPRGVYQIPEIRVESKIKKNWEDVIEIDAQECKKS